ncbi:MULTISPECIES: ESPR-type extended signal peptide-containing protein [Stenotrophomonas]|uniref:ESPR-type extended signal peptide-containing protein n=1 Tax=Stenotrophomonas TaxID=40323 RepID=UPI0008DC8272|nr:ESPR-type extended signal peptide-containing protein [Stenotrophomonas maltophilia]OHY63380.1 hemagluttinin domain-containing protein [Stenotrophomonas maltophilia]HEL4845298.1 YadA-like family protein [Stenotrophomonas maltophilia]
MNRIYRRIWSVAKQCWVVGSELSSPRGKSSRTKPRLLVLAAVASVGMSASAQERPKDEYENGEPQEEVTRFLASSPMISSLFAAQPRKIVVQGAIVNDAYYKDSTLNGDMQMILGSRSSISGWGSVAVGTASALSGKGSVLLGNEAIAKGDRNVVVGYKSEATSGYSTVLGASSVASGVGTTAIGHDARAYAQNSIAVGSGARTVESTAGVSRIAIGGNAFAGTAGYSGAIALGGNSRAEFSGVALGHHAKALADGSAAIGANSEATEANSVSVGNASTKRRIVNVADARLSATSTDAVTGKQLFATQTLAQSINNRVDATALALGKGALVESNTTYGASTAVGNNAKGYNGASVALGDDARAGVDVAGNKANGSSGGVSVGSGTRSAHGAVAMGHKAVAGGNFSVAIGSDAVANEELSTAFGKTSVAGAQQTTALGRGTQATAKFATAVGNLARATGINSLALGNSAHAGHEDAVAIGAGSVTASASSVSVGSASRKRKIQYIADGVVGAGSTDAITGNQLFQTNTRLTAVEKIAGDVTGELAAVKSVAQAATNRIDATTLALGRGATAENGSFGISTALGNNAKAYNGRSVALGDDARAGVDADGNKVANQNAGVSVGAGTRSANGAVATGFRANASGNFSIAIGGDAKAEAEHATAVGYLSKASARQATALGRGSEATAQFASALGNLAKATNTSAVALGDRAQASHENAVALGAGAVTASANSVSVGSASRKRKIQYIADGAVGAGSTDAITGNQLHATNQAVTKAQTAADGATSTANAAKLESGKALAETVVLGGLVNQAAVNGSVRLGEKNSGTQLDVRNSANANRRIMGVADGAISATSNEAVTGKQLHETNANVTAAQTTASAAKVSADKALAEAGVLSGLVGQVAVNGNVRVGEKNSGTVLDVRNSANANRKLTGVADGAVSASSYEAVNGRQLNATNDKMATVEGIARAAGTEAAVAKRDAATALGEAAVLGGLVAQVSATGNVRLGEKNSGTTLDVRNSANANRKISGVADGVLSASSAEAVSGRQLYSTNSRVSDLEGVAQFVSIGSAPISERAQAGMAGVAVGNSAKTGLEGGTAVGTLAEAMGRNSTAIGRGATVSVGSENGFAMGAGAEVGGAAGGASGGVAIGAGARVESGAHGSLALGSSSQANEEGVASFGNAGMQRRLVNIARGTADHNATTVSQLKDSLATLGGGAGMDASGNIIAPTYAVQGGTQNTVEDALMALDGAVVTAGRRADKVEGQLSSIFQDSPSARADGMNQIALNGVNGMVLTNLADGRVAPGSRDAVTGNQLYAAEQKISQNRNDLDAMRKEREMGQQAMRGLDANGPIDFGGALLTGVADGSISADSRDVVTGRQLFGVSDRVSNIEHQGRFLKINTDELSKDAFAGFLGVAIGDSAMTGVDGGTALGAYASALGVSSVALGRGSGVSADAPYGFAVGTGSQVHSARGVAIGSGSVVDSDAAGSLALGANSAATEVGVASFGNATARRRLVNIANGTANHNAATVGQLRGALSALGGEVDANGNIVGPRFNVQGQARSTLNGALEALDGAIVTNTSRVDKVETQLRSVFQDAPSVRADGVNQLTLAGANGMVISNVANGLIAAGSRDAVNGGQLHSMQQQLNGRMDGLEQRIDDARAPRALASSSVPKPQAEETPVVPEGKDSQQVASVGEGDKPAPQPKANKDDSPKPQVDTAELEKMLARANEYTDGAISNFERRLDKMDKRFNRMAAMSSAQTAMAMNTAGLATYNRLGAGVGYSEGESAMAVGYQRVLNEKGSATFSLNGAFTNSGERSMGVGVGIGW